jgi:AmiR/NasT family two-component response regulator
MRAPAPRSRPLSRIPNFRGLRALVLHQPDRNRDALIVQLERLGLGAEAAWPAERASAASRDVVFFDSDTGFDRLFAWPPGEAPIPLIAILGSEAPGRIEWTLAQAPSAYLFKPIGSTGVFSALAIAFHRFAVDTGRIDAIQQMEQRLQMRGTVLAAAIALMRRHGIDERAALAMLRAESMRRRLTLEAVSALLLDGRWLREPAERGGAAGTPPGGSERRVRGG